MNQIPFEIVREPVRIWELEVPVVVDAGSKRTDAYLSGPVVDPCNYNELCYLLCSAKEGEAFFLHINTPGGIIDSALMLVDAIAKTKATVTACLSGTVASAGTLIAMACDTVIASKHLSFMIHNYSGGMSG